LLKLPAPADLPPAEPLVSAETVTVAVPSEEAVGEAKLEVVTPEVIPQVVEAVVSEPTAGAPVAVELVPASENVPADATVIPVVTMEGQPDVMVAVTPETQAALDAAGVDVAKDVGEALIQAEVEVAKAE
jgi:cell envelope opacity-associated protein A